MIRKSSPTLNNTEADPNAARASHGLKISATALRVLSIRNYAIIVRMAV